MDLINQKILIAGGNGFLGGYIVNALLGRGVKKENIFIPNSGEVDLRIFENCLKATEGMDIVIHAAALTGSALYHKEHPGEIFYSNLIMGVQLVEAARRQGVKKIITIGSATEYPEYAPIPFKEEYLWDGFPEMLHAPYAMAKKMLIIQGLAYNDEYGFNAIHLIMTNMYGPKAKMDSGPIPSLIQRIAVAKEKGEHNVVVWGTGTPTRDFLYVEDAAEGIVLAIEKYDKPLPINLGSGKETSLRDLVKKIAALMEFDGELVFDPIKPDGQMRRALDISLARREFGFNSKTDLSTGLQRTIQWYNDEHVR
jgi:GDP-L-fucose synthase